MSEKYSYRAFDSANNIIKILKSTIKLRSNQNSNWNSLIGKYSEDGGFEIHNSKSQFIAYYFGPFIKTNVVVSNINWTGNVSKIVIKRVNGTLYYTFIFITILVAVFIFIKSLIHYIETGELLDIDQHLIPIFCGIFILLTELWAITAFRRLNKKILRMIIDENVELEAL